MSVNAFGIIFTAVAPPGSGRRRRGPREQLDATLGALEVKLSSDQVARLDAVSAIPLGTPHEQIAGSASAMAGGKPELLEVPVIPAA